MSFHKMQDFPEQAKDLKGNLESFSIPVLVFDKDEPKFCEIGHYNFDTNTWSHFGDNSMKLICWCHLPDPTIFLENNNLDYVLHDGYRP